MEEQLQDLLKQQTLMMDTMQRQILMLQTQLSKVNTGEIESTSRVNVPWPQPLDVDTGDLAESFRTFKNRWTNYCVATGMDAWGEDQKERKAGLLISAIGSEAMQKFLDFGLSDTDRKSEKTIFAKMESVLLSKGNVTYSRYVFNARNQTSEKFDEYLLVLRKMIKSCNYGALEDEILRDKLVIGINDNEVKKELLRAPELTLELAINICRLAETASDQVNNLQRSENEVNKIVKRPSTFKMKKEPALCKFCGDTHVFGRANCPAYGKRCESCNGRNHFKRVCKKSGRPSRSIKEIKEYSSSSSEEEYQVIKEIRSNKKGHTEAQLLFYVRDKWIPVFCALDTGAQVCVMGIKDYIKLMGSQDLSNLLPASHRLTCYNGSDLNQYGIAEFTCLRNDKYYKIHFHIVEANHEPLLSERACLDLGLIKYCNSVTSGDIKDRAKAVELFEKYKDIFEGYGQLPGEVSLEIDASVPARIQPARRVPMAIREKLRAELQQLEEEGIIAQETRHTDWVNNILIVNKDSKFRICLDPIPLNKALKRPNFQFTTLDEMLPELNKAKVFTTVDTKKGFWQLKLAEESSRLTTFWTPFGRYRWLRLPFGLSSSPEIFQQKLSSLLNGLKGVEIIADDILIYGVGESVEEAIVDHNIKLEKLFQRLREINCKLNKDKVHLLQSSVKFYGHVLTSEGVKVDESKVHAIKNMPTPKSAKDVLRFLGMVCYLGKFIKNLSFQATNLRRLTRKDVEFKWTAVEESEFLNIKKIISELPVLKYFDVNSNVTIDCDASEFGLGAALYQNDQVICFASRCLSVTEKRYAQIEKEMLAVVFACKKFNQYIAGNSKVTVRTDHKPLVNIMSKPLVEAPKRLQMMLLTLQKYNVELQFIQGSENQVADTLSRAPIEEETNTIYDLENKIKHKQIFKLISNISLTSYLKVSDQLITKIRKETEDEVRLQDLIQYIKNGFPRYISDWPIELRALFKFRHELSTENGLIFRNDQVLIPISLRKIITEKVHVSHNGAAATLRLARENVFWPGMALDIKEYVSKCKFCAKYAASQERQSLKCHEIATHPFQYVSLDVFSVGNLKFLVTVDHYSDFFELDQLSTLTTAEIMEVCSKNFSRNGAPHRLCTDNATNFVNDQFRKFAVKWDFEHVTSSPHFPSSNGKAESAVKIAKRLVIASVENKDDLWYSLLHQRNIPIEADNVSPAQKFFARRTRTGLPCLSRHLKPKVVQSVPGLIKKRKERIKLYYDKKSRELSVLRVGEKVAVQLQPETNKKWSFGTVVRVHNERSYTVDVNGKMYRRNRRHIKPFPGIVTEEQNIAESWQDNRRTPISSSEVPTPGCEITRRASAMVPTTEVAQTASTVASPVQPTSQTPAHRSQRTRILPRRLQDYVLFS